MGLLVWSVALPLWVYLGLALVVGGVCFWWGRSDRAYRRQMRELAEGGSGYWQGRARVKPPREQLPEPMSPRDLPPRGYALDATALEADWKGIGGHLPPLPPAVHEDAVRSPELAAVLEAATEMRRVVLESVCDEEPEPEPGDAEDLPRDEQRVLALGRCDDDRDQDDDPPVGDPTPRYDWSLAKPVNSSHGVAPGWSRWAWYRRRAGRWAEQPRAWWGRLRRHAAGRVGDARLTCWVADLRASRGYTAAHSTQATQSWPWSTVAETVSQRWDTERAAARQRLRYMVAERTGATWGQQFALMREALQPVRRTITPTMPTVGCRP